MLLERIARPPGELVEMLEGTMVFADVSGFTRLSERLARKGKEGAEHLVDAINSCFTALLADASAHGGSLLKFGGDAMLLWFDGAEHARRACSAAYAMRHTLRDVGRIRAGTSDVILRMSVGVHSGLYAMFLVGGSHRELLIGGRPTSEVVALENAASAGQILVSRATAELLPGNSLGQSMDPGILLARAPSSGDWSSANGMLKPTDEAIAACLSSTVRAHLLGGHAAPEHRTATIAFLQFGELDPMIEREGANAAAERLDEVVRLVQDAAERYEVCFLDSDISFNGAKIRLSAGAPRVVGDDEERMLLALRQIVDADLAFPVQVGVNRGAVFTGEVGPPYRRWYAVMGDTVNLAARVMGKAPAGRIYATREVLRHAEGRFRQTQLESFAVKGKARPVQAADVGSPLRAGAQGTARAQLPLVGRERELDLLHDAIAAAERGSGALVELIGETGSGKSRLLAEARKLGEGMVVLRSTCEVVTRETPYFVWRDLLRQLLGVEWDDPEPRVLQRLTNELRRDQPDLLPWLPLLAIAIDLQAPSTPEVDQLAPEARAGRLREVVLRFLGRALVVPTIVEVEHAHLMDAASVALFEALAGELDSTSWMVLVTRRDSVGGLVLPDHPHRRIELGPLAAEDVQALALATSEAARVPPHVLELAVERSGGSPEFLLDLLAAAAAGDREELPESVGAATMARIDALDPRDGAVVRRAAVLGINFHPRRLADVLEADMPLPKEGFWDRLSGVFAREADGHVRFKRPAIQEVAYSSLPFKLRRELHLAVGLRLERDEGHELDADPAILSHHFSRAGDYERAHRYAMAAATRATERFSHADAARLYRRAIEAGRADRHDPESLAEAWEQLGEALRCTGEPDAAARALTEARRLLGDDKIAQARLFHLHAEVAKRSATLTPAVRWLGRGFRCLEGMDDGEATVWRARMRSNLGGIRVRQGRWAEAISTCRQAISEAESVGELPALAHACYVLDWALVESGRSAEATYSERALEIYEQLEDAEHEHMVLNNLGMFAFFEGRWSDAIELYRRAGTCSERAGKPSDRAYTEGNIGEILSEQGHLDDAEAHLQRARLISTSTGDQQMLTFVNVTLARLAVRRGDYERALPMLDAGMADFRKFKFAALAELTHAYIAEAEAFGGDPFHAMEIASEALQASDRQRPLLTRVGAIALARLGQRAAALRELGLSLRTARERHAEYDTAATIDVLAALGEADGELLTERDEILARLQVVRLPAPALGSAVA
jgi:class 3 adenylate cyclase/tetratricopeptide (TPR) repeat protein